MGELIKETTVKKSNSVVDPVVQTTTSINKETSGAKTVEYLVYFLFGGIEMLLAFRFILMITGASLTSAFVNFIYGLSRIFVLPFEGIFSKGVTSGLETTAVFDPATIIAIIVYAIVSFGIVKIVWIFSGQAGQENE